MIMNMSIEKMLSHVYEIEGLMLVTRRLGDENTPEVITNKIKRKVRELAEMCGVELTVAPEAEQPQAPEAVETPKAEVITDNEEKQEVPAQQPIEDIEEEKEADETCDHDNNEDFNEIPSLDEQEPAEQEPVAQPTPPACPVTPPAPVEQETAVTPPAPVHLEPPVTPPPFREELNDEPVPEPDPEVVPEDDRDLEDITVEFIMPEDEELPEPEEEMPTPPVPTEFPEVDEQPEPPLRVDEKLQRKLSKDIRKAFSVNDRFRFQRELFAGSANAMNTAIEHIEIMRSYGNAELYFYSQLNWDRENEVVQDFMEIVRNHFQG